MQLKCTQTENLTKQRNIKQKINEIFRCEHCKKDYASTNYLKPYMELQKMEENEQHNRWCSSNKSKTKLKHLEGR